MYLSNRAIIARAYNYIQIWRCADATGLWQEEEVLPGHSDWVRDVAWAPNMGLPRSTIASAGQDGQVRGVPDKTEEGAICVLQFKHGTSTLGAGASERNGQKIS